MRKGRREGGGSEGGRGEGRVKEGVRKGRREGGGREGHSANHWLC